MLTHSRLSEKENELEQFRLDKLAEWKATASNLQRWLNQQDLKLQSFDELSSDLDEVRRQKTETEVGRNKLFYHLNSTLIFLLDNLYLGVSERNGLREE